MIRKLEGIAAFFMLFTVIVILQVLGGAYASGFGSYPDEAMHFVSALMIRDFLVGLDFDHPWHFAQQYYLHYPKVGIGHWPPLLHATLGVWFVIFGASRTSSMLFIAVLAATTAAIIYSTGKRLIGRCGGALAAVLFIASPLVQESSARVMIEHLVTLVMLVSALFFGGFAKTGRVADGLAFGTAAMLAILTRGSAWALGLLPPFTIMLTNRWYLLRRLGLWLGAVPPLLACVPWYILTRSMYEGTWVGGGTSYLVQAAPGFSRSLYLALGLPVLLAAAIGIWVTLVSVRKRAEVVPEWAALAGLAAATFILHCVVPVAIEDRYMVTLVPPIVLFAAAGIHTLAKRSAGYLPTGVTQAGLAVVLLAAFSLETFALPLRLKNGGYEALAREVLKRVSNVPQVWLIASGATGEGSLVAAVALQESRLGSYILLGKKILAGGDMLGRNTEDRFDTPDKLAALLNELPVTIIVIDDQVPLGQRYPYHARLRDLVANRSDRWELIGSFPETQEGVGFPSALHVYARRPVAVLSSAPPVVRTDRLVALIGRDELRGAARQP